MRPKSIQLLAIHCFILVLILAASLLSQGCAGPVKSHQESPPYAPADDLSSACINVHGTVFGDPVPDAKVSLYEISSLNYSIVMAEIRTKQAFNFSCLSTGNYAFVIPAWSYSGAVGSPLPYEFDCENLSPEIAFQGGDHEYSVGVFSIQHTFKRNSSVCRDGPISCPKRGRLYHHCPLGRG